MRIAIEGASKPVAEIWGSLPVRSADYRHQFCNLLPLIRFVAGADDWESQIGRRLPLRDLHVFSTVVRLGSMPKA